MSYICGFCVKTLHRVKKVLKKAFEKISFGLCRKLYRKMKYRMKDPRNIAKYSLEYKLERRIRFQFALIGVLGLSLIALAVYNTTALFLTEYYRPKICLSEECVGTASRILDSLNRDVDPCQDFYEFACGGWIKQNPVPEWTTLWNQLGKARAQLVKDLRELLEEENDDGLPEAVLKAKSFYRTCEDTDKLEEYGIKPIQKILQKLGLPPHPPVMASGNFTWEVTAGRGRRMLGVNVLLGVQVAAHYRNTSRYRIQIDQVSPGFNEEYLLKPTWFAYELAHYHKHIKAMIALVDPDIDAHNFADDVIEFSKRLAKIMSPEEQRRGSGHSYYEMSVEQLLQGPGDRPAQWKEQHWEQYLKLVFANTSVTINPQQDRVIIADMPYLQKLSVVLNETEPILIERFLWWNMFSEVAPMTLAAFRELQFELAKAIDGIPQRTPRWKSCTAETNNNFGEALSYLYVKRFFDEGSRLQALEMIGDVREAFAETIQQVDWMDSSTKVKTLKKLKAIRNLVGFPEWLLTDEQLNKHYEDVEVVEGNLFETYMNLNWAAVKKSLESLRETPDRNTWVAPPTTINAFYSNSYNSISFPAGILQPPFYGNGIEAVNYGAIGALMGHEITHGFDNQGRKYDEEGNLKQWWSTATLEHFQDKVQCIIDQYSKYHMAQLPNYTVHGFNTQGENIADNGGLRAALRAYRRYGARAPARARDLLPALPRYSPEQLFFLGFAQIWCGNSTLEALQAKITKGVHSPNKIRVIGTLSNSEDFAQAWKCPKGSPMNPENKCVLW